MNIKMKKNFAIILIFITMIPLVPRFISAWRADITNDDFLFTTPKFSTHQWLSWEAVDMFPEAQISWITENLFAFWHGVEAPFNENSSYYYGYSGDDYEDIDSLILYLNDNGTIVINDSLALRAEEEYNKLVTELNKETNDYSLAAFYAGTMSHYIAQAGFWVALWNESLWGPLSNWTHFEYAIEVGNTRTIFVTPKFNFRFYDMSVYGNNYFPLTPSKITPTDGYNTTMNLAKNVHQYAKALGDNLNTSYTNANQWPTSYKTNVSICLTYSVEAIYAALKHAMDQVNWRYISMPIPIFNYDNITNLLTIPEFSVKYYDENGSYNLNDSLATKANAYYVYYDQYNQPVSLSTNKLNLEYNDTTEKWFYPETQRNCVAAKTKHTLLYRFDMNRTSPTWSNSTTDTFYVDYFNASILTCDYYYSSTYRTISVYNITANCTEIPEIGMIEPIDVTGAMWFLYQQYTGSTQTGESLGAPMSDTEGKLIRGNLTYNYGNNTWESKYNDVGLVFTQSSIELYIIVRFNLTVPVGYFKKGIGPNPQFIPFLQFTGTDYFITRDHNVTVTKPRIVFDPINQTLNIYDIKAWADYNNTELNYYEIVEKSVLGDDRRNRRWNIFLFDGIRSGLTGLLLWNDSDGAKYWYAENISLSSLPDNSYYIAAKITNQNMNFTTAQWGPASDLFEIKRPLPVVYYILPEIFLIGFVALFGWLAWYRPRKKRLQIEKERAEKIDKGYMD